MCRGCRLTCRRCRRVRSSRSSKRQGGSPYRRSSSNPSLTQRIVADLNQSDALPLLAFTLERLVANYGSDGKLELAKDQHGLGGLEGTIHKAVDAAFSAAKVDSALPDDQASLEALARRAFIPWLVKVDDVEGAPKRRVATIGELPAETRQMVGHFVNQRILVSDTRENERTLEVSHESMLRHWKALSGWIDEERASLLATEAVRRAAADWQRRPSGSETNSRAWLVHRGERLTEAETLSCRSDYERLFDEQSRAYLNACRAQEDTDRRAAEEQLQREQLQLARQRALQQKAGLALALFALVVVAFALVAFTETRSASREKSLLFATYAQRAIAEGNHERAARLATLAAREDLLRRAPRCGADVGGRGRTFVAADGVLQ